MRVIRFDDINKKHGDTTHEVMDMKLSNEGELHRFKNGAGVPYSAIYQRGIEWMSSERKDERGMIECWEKNKRAYKIEK